MGQVDKKDLHVAAAAQRLSLTEDADVSLVTANLRDLPIRAFKATRITPLSPDEFLIKLIEKQPEQVAETLKETCRRLQRPLISQEDLLHLLKQSQCSRFSERLSIYWNIERLND